MRNEATLNQSSATHCDESYGRSKRATREANHDIVNEEVIMDPTKTNIGDTIVHNPIMDHSPSLGSTNKARPTSATRL
jgi:hypothetical protein